MKWKKQLRENSSVVLSISSYTSMHTHLNKRLYRSPRVLSLIFLLFILLLSFDVFAPEYTWQEMLIWFLMHNISTVVVWIVVSIARKHEIVGAYAFAGLGLLYMSLIARSAYQSWFERYLLAWTLQISWVLFLVSRLFRKWWHAKK